MNDLPEAIPNHGELELPANAISLVAPVDATAFRDSRYQERSISACMREILKSEPGCYINIHEMAQRFCMSSRTLSRRLSKERVNYRELATEIRMDMARAYLSDTDMAIREISARVGYRDVSNFTKAFKRANNMTPFAYRSAIKTGELSRERPLTAIAE